MVVILTGEDYENHFNIDRYTEYLYKNPSPSMAAMVEFCLKFFHEAFEEDKMVVILTGEDYENHFNIDRYTEYLYKNPSPSTAAMVEFCLRFFHEAFEEGKLKGLRLLDIGTGPSIHTIVSASRYVDEIYLSDYSKRLIAMLNKWMKGEIAIQEKQVQGICDLENKGQKVEERVSEIRKKVKQVAFIDVTVKGSLAGSDIPTQFDIITSCWCIDKAGIPKENYIKCVKHIHSLLKPNGYLVLFGYLDCSLFTIDDCEFPILNVSAEQLRQIYEEEGFKILTMKEKTNEFETLTGDKIFGLTAQKIA